MTRVECVVLRVDEEEKKISLGMKQTEEDPWLALPAKYPPGSKISGVVRNLTSFGAFVEVEPGIDGLVHISDMSWTRRVQHPSEVVRKGEEVEVVALSIDPDQKRISLGLKQVDDDPWYELAQRFEPGTEIRGACRPVAGQGSGRRSRGRCRGVCSDIAARGGRGFGRSVRPLCRG